MSVPGFHQTGRDIKNIRLGVDVANDCPSLRSLDLEAAALEDDFLNNVIGGPKSKDIDGNDVLLLDYRWSVWSDYVESTLRGALRKQRPKHIRLILLVGFERDALTPKVAKVFP